MTHLRVNCYNFSAAATNHQDSFQSFCEHLQELHVWISSFLFVLLSNIWGKCHAAISGGNVVKDYKLKSLQLSKNIDIGFCAGWWNMNIKYQILMKIMFIVMLMIWGMTWAVFIFVFVFLKIWTYMSSLCRPPPLLGDLAGSGSLALHRETLPQSPEIWLFKIWFFFFILFQTWNEHQPRLAWLRCAFSSRWSSPWSKSICVFVFHCSLYSHQIKVLPEAKVNTRCFPFPLQIRQNWEPLQVNSF